VIILPQLRGALSARRVGSGGGGSPGGSPGGGGSPTDGDVPDPYWSIVVLLCHADGADGPGTPVNVVQSLGRGAILSGGAGMQFDTDQTLFGSSSMLIGNDTTRYVVSDSHAHYAMASFEFTIEFAVRLASLTTAVLFDTRPASNEGAYLALTINSSGDLIYRVSSATRITGSAALTVNTWHRIAISRRSGTTRLFVDGVQVGSDWTDSTNYLQSRVVFGASSISLGTSPCDGWIDEMRITRGAGRYTTTYTVDTVQFSEVGYTEQLFLTHLDSTAWTDVHGHTPSMTGSVTSVAGESGFSNCADFPSGTNYIGYPAISGDFNIGMIDYTLDFRVYITRATTAGEIMVSLEGAASVGLRVTHPATGVLQLEYDNNQILNTGYSVVNDAWNYIRVVRIANNTRVYVAGVFRASTSGAMPLTNVKVTLGAGASGSSPLIGNIDEVRFIKGIAIDGASSSYTVDTSPFSDTYP